MLEKIGIHYVDLERIREDAIIVDAGACMGNYIETLNGKIKKCKIIAIECDPDNVLALKKRGFENVTLCEKALVGHKQKDVVIYHKYFGLPYSGSVGYEKTYIKQNTRKYHGMMKYEVEAFGINDIFSEFGIDRIDYLKMNIEGMERDVLAAMTQETASKIDQISVSIHAKILKDLEISSLRDTAETDMRARLKELGFNVEKVDRRLFYGVREV